MIRRLRNPAPVLAPVLALVLGLVSAAPPAVAQDLPPGQILEGVAPVGPANTERDPDDGMLAVTLAPDPVQARRPLLDERMTRPAAEWLRARARRGWAAGMAGFIYDNRDRGHSVLGQRNFPQLARTQYAKVYRDRGLDYGTAGPFRFDMPVIGNSSTAVTSGPFARSQARAAVTGRAAAERAFRLYATNHLYFYPEHRDHDPGTGDRFFANVPFAMSSQGSSGSEKGLMRGAAMALAAMRPDTFAAARDGGLIAPTLQMLMRSNRPQAAADYLSGAAHPSAFPQASLDTLGLVQDAHALLPGDLPPMVRLSVEHDFAARPGRDYPDPAASEQLFTTPAAVARAWRSLDYRRQIVLDAGDTVDPNGRALVFDWVVLRGDPDRIAIAHDADDPARTRATITIDWHDAYRVPGRDDLTTARVDIGVFARNGAAVSAPSFLSVVFPVHQARRYEAGPDGRMRIAEVSWRRPARGEGFGGGYVDPALWATADWTDHYDWPAGGGFATVTRRYGDGTERVLHQGLRGLHAPGETAPLAYSRTTDNKGRPVVRDNRAALPG